MKFTMNMFMAMLAGATLAAATPIVEEEPKAPSLPLPVVPVEWTGPWGPDGEEIKFEGTLEQLMGHVHTINPSYVFNMTESDPDDVQLADKDEYKLKCDIDYAARTQNGPIWRGIKYLRGLKGNFKLKYNGCGRISCSDYGGIWNCWDKQPKEIKKPWGHAADGAELIAEECPYKYQKVKGEAIDDDGVKIVVGWDEC